ncbi:M23 family metallopeptidase [Kitasatospora sp. NPDC006697]|uniref:M23 family metallopeptidase n=1 Tax=Kitasatospora sp. NPDC006697 TaxID=3364020 RepID=UPI0036AD48F2
MHPLLKSLIDGPDGRHARPRQSRDPYAVFRGPNRRAALTATAAGAVLLGTVLAAVPGSAVAQTVRPTTPGASAFTAGHGHTADGVLVQLTAPTAYRVKGGAYASQKAVAVAANLAPADAPGPAQPQPAAAPEPPQQPQQPAAPAQPAAAAPPPAPAGPVWSAPAPGAPISNPYGKPDRGYAAGYHTGVDFAVNSGTPLLAVGDATVVSAGWDGAYGNEVVLRLSDGRFAEYAHLSHLEVHAGQRVGGGQRIGASGTTGNSTGPHLHFEIRSANRYGAVIDPVAYLGSHGVTGL